MPAPGTVKPPMVKLAASTTKASVGDKVRLRWHSKRADVVMASGDWAGAQKSKGSVTVRIAERGKHVFKLTVKNASGRQDRDREGAGRPQGQGPSSSWSPRS